MEDKKEDFSSLMSQTDEIVQQMFVSHQVNIDAAEKICEIMAKCGDLAKLIAESVNLSAEKWDAIKKLQEVMFVAKAGIEQDEDNWPG